MAVSRLTITFSVAACAAAALAARVSSETQQFGAAAVSKFVASGGGAEVWLPGAELAPGGAGAKRAQRAPRLRKPAPAVLRAAVPKSPDRGRHPEAELLTSPIELTSLPVLPVVAAPAVVLEEARPAEIVPAAAFASMVLLEAAAEPAKPSPAALPLPVTSEDPETTSEREFRTRLDGWRGVQACLVEAGLPLAAPTGSTALLRLRVSVAIDGRVLGVEVDERRGARARTISKCVSRRILGLRFPEAPAQLGVDGIERAATFVF